MINKTLTLAPSTWKLDIYIGDQDEVAEALHHKYGESITYYRDAIADPCVTQIYSNRDKEEFIVLYLPNYDERTAVHEAVHVFWYWARAVGWNSVDFDAQEMQALFVDNIYGEIMKLKNLPE